VLAARIALRRACRAQGTARPRWPGIDHRRLRRRSERHRRLRLLANTINLGAELSAMAAALKLLVGGPASDSQT
jgi:hypothetical protein